MNLTDYVKTVSIEDFGWKFKHQALWNKRLRTTGGRFFPKDGHLDFNPKLYEEHGLETFRKIVRHELCHYHLYFQGKGCKHGDRDFKDLLARVDGLRYAPKCETRQKITSFISANLVVTLTVANAVSIHRNLDAVCAKANSFSKSVLGLIFLSQKSYNDINEMIGEENHAKSLL